MQQVELIIHGKVQGVFYRLETQEKALQLGLSGFARNNRDGTITICAVGAPDNLAELVRWCRKGPELASVESVDITYQGPPKTSFSGFVTL